MTPSTPDDHRRRYEELKAKGSAPKTLPPPTARDGAPIPDAAIRRRETIPGGWYWTTPLTRGQAVRVLNTSGTPGVSLFAWSRHDTAERLNAADTVKVQWTAKLQKGRVLLSDMGRVLLSITEDTSGRHDAVAGGSTPASVAARFGRPERNTAENLILAASKWGLGRRDVGPCVTLFAPVVTGDDGRLAWAGEGAPVPGDFVDLRAEMDLILALSNGPHPLAPVAVFDPGPVEAIVFDAPPAGPDDLCRTATDEAVRAFENTDALHAALA